MARGNCYCLHVHSDSVSISAVYVSYVCIQYKYLHVQCFHSTSIQALQKLSRPISSSCYAANSPVHTNIHTYMYTCAALSPLRAFKLCRNSLVLFRAVATLRRISSMSSAMLVDCAKVSSLMVPSVCGGVAGGSLLCVLCVYVCVINQYMHLNI